MGRFCRVAVEVILPLQEDDEPLSLGDLNAIAFTHTLTHVNEYSIVWILLWVH